MNYAGLFASAFLFALVMMLSGVAISLQYHSPDVWTFIGMGIAALCGSGFVVSLIFVVAERRYVGAPLGGLDGQGPDGVRALRQGLGNSLSSGGATAEDLSRQNSERASFRVWRRHDRVGLPLYRMRLS